MQEMLPVVRGAIDSPPDQSTALQQLAAIEAILRATSPAAEHDSDVFCGSVFDAAAQHARVCDELWSLLLDVVCSSLWVRLRAAALLNVCFAVRNDALRVTHQNAYWVRSIVSSTCQVLDELDATERHQAESLFEWLEFLEHVLVTTPSDVFAKVLRHSMYAGMLTKMLRLLSACSTKVFAATTMVIAAFYAHERECAQQRPTQRLGVLVDQVLAEHRDGREHFGGALLHVINSCGYPCPETRVVHLWNALQLFGDVLAHPKASQLVFLNDFKVLLDVIIRECVDRPRADTTRLHLLVLLDRALGSTLYRQAHRYRHAEIFAILEDLLAIGAAQTATTTSDVDDEELPLAVVAQTKRLLLQHIDLLD